LVTSIAQPIKTAVSPMVPKKGGKGTGTHLVTFHGRPILWNTLLGLFLPACLAALAPCVYGYVRAIEVYTINGPSAALAASYPWFLLAAFALIPLLWLSIIHLRRSHFFISIYENGLWIRFAMHKPLWLTWQNIAGIAHGSIQDRWLAFTLHTYHYATIFPTMGKPIRIDDRLAELNIFIERVKELLNPHLLMAYQDDFKKDRWIHFGPISIHRRGYRISNQSHRSNFFDKVIHKPYSNTEMVPWNSVASLSVKNGYLIIVLKQGRSYRQAVLTIPNLDLLLQIIDWGINP
jgi:hypothetical protein